MYTSSTRKYIQISLKNIYKSCKNNININESQKKIFSSFTGKYLQIRQGKFILIKKKYIQIQLQKWGNPKVLDKSNLFDTL